MMKVEECQRNVEHVDVDRGMLIFVQVRSMKTFSLSRFFMRGSLEIQ